MSILDTYGVSESDIKEAADYNQGAHPMLGLGVYKVNNCAMKISKKEKCPLFTMEMSCEEHSDPNADLQVTYSIVVKFGSDRLKWPNKLGQIKKILAPLLGKNIVDVTKADIDVYEKNVYFSQGRTFIVEASPSEGKDGKSYVNHIYHTVTPERLAKLRAARDESVRLRAVLGTPTVSAPSSAQNTSRPTVNTTPAVAADSDLFDIF